MQSMEKGALFRANFFLILSFYRLFCKHLQANYYNISVRRNAF